MHLLSPSILFEDTHLIIIDKPAGLLSQGESTGDANVVDWARQYLSRNYVGLVHRLDRNTSGVMILAKRSKSATRLTDSLQEGLLKRNYLAWLVGRLGASARWEHWLIKNEQTNKVTAYRKSTAQAKHSALIVEPIESGRFETLSLTLAKFTLETGRTHQIRAQAMAEKLPLLGDVKYGADPLSARFGRPALHSYEIEFPHPISKEVLRFKAPLPKDMSAIRSGESSL